MAAGTAWVLNLDADLELGARAHYQPRSSVTHAMRPHVARLAASLLGPNDVLVDEAALGGASLPRVGPPPSPMALGLAGRAFCPTPRALRILARAGAVPEPHPSVEVLRRVGSRAFASALGPTLPGAAFVTTLQAARAKVEGKPAAGEAWRIKHAFGMAGRNQRVVAAGPLSERDLGFVQRGLSSGGVQIEPNVAVEQEYAIHGMLRLDGSLRVGALVRQWCDRSGAWLSTERIPEQEALGTVRDRMATEVCRVAHALFHAGYFGPFGIDAYEYRDAHGALLLQPRSEVNARYTMGFAVGFNPAARAAPPA